MAEYTIVKVGEAREWAPKDNPERKVYYIQTALKSSDGKIHHKGVEIGKKDPLALKVGDKVQGTIERTQYENDKFVADKSAFGGGFGNKRDDAAIKAQFAIKAAVQLFGNTDKALTSAQLDVITTNAKNFFGMVDTVKGESKPAETPENKKEAETPPAKPPKDDVILDDIGDEPINLDDIPF